MFKRPATHYGKTPQPATPYQRAAQVWDDRIGSARVQARNWRLMAFGSLILSAGLSGVLVWQSANGSIVPWVVQVDRLGQAQAIAPAVADYRPTDPQIAWHLARFCFCEKCGGAMTIRTGKGGRYRYYTCSIKARQGETGCSGRSIPMEKLDTIVASHIEDRLLQPDRLEEVLASVLDRRSERAERRQEHIGELNRRAAETDLRLKRLYDAIESGVADLSDPALKDRITGLKALRDQAQVDAERAQAMLESSGNQAVTPAAVRRFADVARQRIRLDGGGYRRDHLRAFAQRVEVGEVEVRIMGSKGELLRTLSAVSSGKSAAIGVPSLGLKWRSGGAWRLTFSMPSSINLLASAPFSYRPVAELAGSNSHEQISLALVSFRRGEWGPSVSVSR